jgi:hypothetical protein
MPKERKKEWLRQLRLYVRHQVFMVDLKDKNSIVYHLLLAAIATMHWSKDTLALDPDSARSKSSAHGQNLGKN